MATYNVTRSAHKTLTTTTVDTVNILQPFDIIRITNYDGTNRLFVTFDGTDPTAAGDNTLAIPVSQMREFTSQRPSGSVVGTNAHTIKVIGNGGAYSVEGIVGLG